MRTDLVFHRYRRFAFLLFFCGMLYGTAFYGFSTRHVTLSITVSSLCDLTLTAQNILFVFDRLLPLFFLNGILYLIGTTCFCGMLSCVFLFLCGQFYSFFAACLFCVTNKIPFLVFVLICLYLFVFILISLCWQMNYFSHSVRTCKDKKTQIVAFRAYTAYFLRALPLQILLILSVWFTVSHYYT